MQSRLTAATPCGLRSLRWAHAFLWTYVLIIAVLLFATPAHAAPSFSIDNATAAEDSGTIVFRVRKHGKLNNLPSIINLYGVDGTAKFPFDFDSMNQSVTFTPAETVKMVAIHLVNDNVPEPTETFTAKIRAVSNARLYDGTAIGTITDSDVAPAPTPAPATGPLPPLIPAPYGSMATRTCPSGQVILDQPGLVCNPRPPVPPLTMHGVTFMGETPIPDNFDLVATSAVVYSDTANPTTGLWYGGVPAHSDEGGNFRFVCLPGQLGWVDPLVSPGQRSMHPHQFFGNTQVTPNSTSQSLRTTGRSTCSNPLNGPANRTAYWLPAMLDGAGNAVKPDLAQIYYKQHPASDPACAESGQCIGVPTALRYTWGYPYMDPTAVADPANSMNRFECWHDLSGSTAAPGVSGIFHTIADTVAAGCGSGALLIINFVAPDCWNGVIDAPDHRSNMAYPTRATPNGFRCPLTHPYWTPNLSGYIAYTTDANFAAGKWRLSSDDMLAAMLGHAVAAGSTLHFDYWEAWSPVVKATWQHYCIDLSLNCAGGDLGDGTAMNHDDLGPRPTHQLVPLN